MSDTSASPPLEAPADAAAAEAAPTEAATAAAAPPDVVTRADLETFGRSLVDGLREALAPPPPPPLAPQLPADVPDAEIAAAVEQGNGTLAAQLMTRRAEAVAARQTSALRQEVEQLRQTGASSLSSLALSSIANRPGFARYRAEIEQKLNVLQPESRANPAIVEQAYHLVRGMHADEETAAATAAALRAAREPAPSPSPGAAGRAEGAGMPKPLREVVPQDVRRVVDDAGLMAEDLRRRNVGRVRAGLKPIDMAKHEADLRAEFDTKGAH